MHLVCFPLGLLKHIARHLYTHTLQYTYLIHFLFRQIGFYYTYHPTFCSFFLKVSWALLHVFISKLHSFYCLHNAIHSMNV